MGDSFPPEERLVTTLQEIANQYDDAEIRREDRRDSGPRVHLSSGTPGTVRVSAIALDERQVDLWVGETKTPIECIRRRGESSDSFLKGIRVIVEAMAEGRFHETVWEGGGRVLRRRSVLATPDGTMTFWYGRAAALLKRGRRREILYSPYPRRAGVLPSD
jgi:hypothetical protein